jgi:ABC-2 type transport system permease protein
MRDVHAGDEPIDTGTDGGAAAGTDSTPSSTGTRRTGGYRHLVVAMAKKRAMLLVRYPLNTLSSLATIFVFFTLIFFGGRALSQQALTDSLGGIIVGFFLYTIALTAFQSQAWSVTRESQWGTLEQLFMSPFGFGRVMVVNIAVRVVESFLWGAMTLVFMLALTGESLALNVVTILVLGVLAVASAVGLGFVFGGLAMLYKRIENVFQLVTFGFIGLIAAPVGQVPLLKALPVTQGSYLLRVAMQDGRRLWELPPVELAILVATAVGYFAVGYAFFLWASRRARRQGVMGKY